MSDMTFFLSSLHGWMMATFLSGIAWLEREMNSELVKSGLAAAKAKGRKPGRQHGQRPKSEKLALIVIALMTMAAPRRLISAWVGAWLKTG